MKTWLIIGLLSAQLVVTFILSMQLVDLRSTIERLRGDMNTGLIQLKMELHKQGQN